MKKRNIILAILSLLLLAAPAAKAVLDEADLEKTLSVLRYELNQEIQKRQKRSDKVKHRNDSQHAGLVTTMKKCNELALVLYSQKQDYTFDMTYALREVTREYEDFTARRMPFDEMISSLDMEISRYSRLVESLRRLPPQINVVPELPDSLAYHNDSICTHDPLTPHRHVMVNGHMVAEEDHDHDEDAHPVEIPGLGRIEVDSLTQSGLRHPYYLSEKSCAERDSCLLYATTLLKMYSDFRGRLVSDNEHYEDARARLKESYDYAQERYTSLQKKMFTKGQDYFVILGNFRLNFKYSMDAAHSKYSSNFSNDSSVQRSEWRGPMVLGFIWVMLGILLLSTVVSFLCFRFVLPRFRYFRSEKVASRRSAVILMCGVAVFALAVLVGYTVIDNNFFRMASGLIMVYVWFLSAIILSTMIRVKPGKLRHVLMSFLPLCLMGLGVITVRIVFLPNSVINLFYPPILLLCMIWQFAVCRRNTRMVDNYDMIVSWSTFVVFLVATIMAWTGYVLLAVLVVIWWLFQVAMIETVIALAILVRRYRGSLLETRKDQLRNYRDPSSQKAKGQYFRITWVADLMEMVVMPILGLVSIPLCVWLAMEVFDMGALFEGFYPSPFFNLLNADGNPILPISMKMIVVSGSLYFIFRYISYAAKAMYRYLRFSSMQAAAGEKYVHTNEINLTLADNVIGFLVWGTYVIVLLVLLKIPTGALSIVAAGLATGLGLAMKDILNNFIYSIQLMTGRLRVGDWVECDGIRGTVQDISYQSTQIETVDGAVISFLNADLFAKNFKNLTRNNAYELVKIGVGVAYGSDVEAVRLMLTEALMELRDSKVHGHKLVDPSRGLSVTFDDFGDSSVDLCIKQFVLVQEKTAYIAQAKEIIYNTLNENHVNIPFPQRDIHVITESR